MVEILLLRPKGYLVGNKMQFDKMLLDDKKISTSLYCIHLR